jgi:tetratricopeptide (TPR) repeat protein
LARQCGHLPLTLAVSGANLAANRHQGIADLLTAVAKAKTFPTRAERTVTTDDDISRILTAAYKGLAEDPAAQLLYRRLGSAHPGPDFTIEAAATLIEAPPAEATRTLTVLTAVRLLERTGQGRYRFHDEVRQHAKDLSDQTDPPQECHDAFTRLAHRYRLITVAAQLTINPGRWFLGPDYDKPVVLPFANPKAALAWMETERDNLRVLLRTARETGPKEVAWQLVEAQWGRYVQHRANHDCVDDHTLGLQAARDCGDDLAMARMLEGLAFGELNLKHYANAITHCQQALDLEQSNGHLVGEAAAREILGSCHLGLHETDPAEEQFRRNIEIHQHENRPRGVALNQRHLAEAAALAGRHAEAINLYKTALDFYDRYPFEVYHQCRARSLLAASLLTEDRSDDAARVLEEALDIAKKIDARNEQAHIHTRLAEVAARRNDPETEHAHLRQAHTIFSQLGAVIDAQQVRNRMGD